MGTGLQPAGQTHLNLQLHLIEGVLEQSHAVKNEQFKIRFRSVRQEALVPDPAAPRSPHAELAALHFAVLGDVGLRRVVHETRYRDEAVPRGTVLKHDLQAVKSGHSEPLHESQPLPALISVSFCLSFCLLFSLQFLGSFVACFFYLFLVYLYVQLASAPSATSTRHASVCSSPHERERGCMHVQEDGPNVSAI